MAKKSIKGGKVKIKDLSTKKDSTVKGGIIAILIGKK